MAIPVLAGLMHDVATILGEPVDLSETLARVTRTARDLVPGVDYASISVRRPDGTLETLVPTDLVTVQADLVQHELEEGPCYDAVTDKTLTYALDLANEPRWPTYGPKAAALGVSSQLAVRLYDQAGTRAGLNLYAITAGALDGSLESAEALGCLAQVALIHARDRETLAEALHTRETIGKAVGIVMERYDVSGERAFSYLVRRSQTSNVKLRDIAAEIADRRSAVPRTPSA